MSRDCLRAFWGEKKRRKHRDRVQGRVGLSLDLWAPRDPAHTDRRKHFIFSPSSISRLFLLSKALGLATSTSFPCPTFPGRFVFSLDASILFVGVLP